MNKEILRELLKEIKNDNLYDYISKKGYILNKEDLITIIKELSDDVYVLHIGQNYLFILNEKDN